MSFASTRLPQPISFPTSERGIIVLFNNTTKEMSKICERPHEIAIYSTRKIFLKRTRITWPVNQSKLRNSNKKMVNFNIEIAQIST